MSKTIYRRATPYDLTGIVKLGEEMHQETAFSNIEFSVERTASEAMRCIMSGNYFANIAEKDGEIVGLLFGYLEKPFFTEQVAGYDCVWYVSRKVRNTMVGPRLLKQFEAWTKMHGGSIVFTTLGSNFKPERVGKMMERMGFEHQGGFYRKDI
ncbi:MAG: GNAT family N-acetyltransferase [Acidimicrobiales bacterium]